MGTKGRETQEAKVENNTQQQPDYSYKAIFQKMESIENKIDSSSQTQILSIFYALGAAFMILGLSYWPGLLEQIGMDTARFYLINPVALLVLGFITMLLAAPISKAVQRRGKGKQMGTKGRKNIKKPKMTKEQKEARKKKK